MSFHKVHRRARRARVVVPLPEGPRRIIMGGGRGCRLRDDRPARCLPSRCTKTYGDGGGQPVVRVGRGPIRSRAAFDVTALKSQLMVTALSCHAQERYNEFVTRYRNDLVKEERALDSYFGRTSSRSARQDHDDYITNLANAQSEAGIRFRSPDLIAISKTLRRDQFVDQAQIGTWKQSFGGVELIAEMADRMVGRSIGKRMETDGEIAGSCRQSTVWRSVNPRHHAHLILFMLHTYGPL